MIVGFKFHIMENNFFIVLKYVFIYILMCHNDSTSF